MKKQKYFMVMYRPKGSTIFTPVNIDKGFVSNSFGNKGRAESFAERFGSENPDCEYSVFCLMEQD